MAQIGVAVLEEAGTVFQAELRSAGIPFVMEEGIPALGIENLKAIAAIRGQAAAEKEKIADEKAKKAEAAFEKSMKK